VDFQIVLLELFARCYGTTTEYRLKIGVNSLQAGQFDPKFQVEGIVPYQQFFLPESYGIRMSAQVSFTLSQFTRLTDRRTGRQTDISLVAKTVLHKCTVKISYAFCSLLHMRNIFFSFVYMPKFFNAFGPPILS